MNYTVSHELPNRLRLSCGRYAFSPKQAMLVSMLLQMQDGVKLVKVSHRTGSILLLFDKQERKKMLLATVQSLTEEQLNDQAVLAEVELPPKRESLIKMITKQVFFYVIKLFLPSPVRVVLLYYQSVPYVVNGVSSALSAKKLNADLLDATSIFISLLRKDYGTARNITFLLKLGDTVEEWTKKTSLEDLAATLALSVDSVWVVQEGEEREIAFDHLKIDDIVVVRQGTAIPIDGVIVNGNGVINEASITGEPLPVNSFKGKTVYAGTILEEGEIQVQVKQKGGSTVVEKTIQQIDQSQALKSATQFKAENFADSLVPFNFLGALLVWIFTRDIEKTSSLLAVDYSCAIKLATPLIFLSAMKEGAKNGVIVKGGKFIDLMEKSDTIVFDKTGTLTSAEPHLTKVTSVSGMEERELLKIAACLEEHFPHSVARAVVRKAEEQNIVHQEEHTKVEYIVAHGIVSTLYGQRVIIGSHHFVFEDEKVPLSPEDKKTIEELSAHASLLYLGIDNKLAGIFSIEDSLRPEANKVIKQLSALGFTKIHLLTGDEKRTAKWIAKQVGIENFQAELLPEDKSKIVASLREQSSGIVMVGDGINDTPALSAADVGISMQRGADITQAVSDISLANPSLHGIVDARRLSVEVMQRITYSNYRIVGLNSLLILLSLMGTTSTSLLALLHNSITFSEALLSMRPLIDWQEEIGE